MEIEVGSSHNNTTECKENLKTIPIIENLLDYDYFFKNYLLPNKPCIIRNITTNWESTRYWLTNNKPNLKYLLENYGESDVCIYDCGEKYFNSQKTTSAKFKDYVGYWNKENGCDKLLYLKDWHLKLKYPEDNFYNVPIYFASDWLNEYFVECLDDDYRFVYMGIKNTWTPFHADVFNSFSWSANVCGRKKWIFFPPGEELYLKDCLNNLPYDVTKVTHNRKYFEIIQQPGDAVFVPSCWHHQVYNLEDTISINHNWVNGCNIGKMWESIQNNLVLIKKQIEDCNDMDNFLYHCQVMLNSSFGMDYLKFYDFLNYIALKRIEHINSNKQSYNGYRIGKNHTIFDLKAIKGVLELFILSNDVSNLNYFDNVNMKPKDLLQNITNTINNN